MNRIVVIIYLILLLISPSFPYDNNKQAEEVNEYLKRYLCIGFLDHKTGTSLIGYARTLMNNNTHELFVGLGTLFTMFTLSVGWKYYFNDSPLQVYSVFAVQGISGMGGSLTAPFISLGFEKILTKKLYLNLGVNLFIRIYSNKSTELVTYPNININMRY